MRVPIICVRRLRQLQRPFSVAAQTPKVAIVGSGPAGFYTAQQILKGHPSALVDVYEKLPVPFGLVRFGVAPDHPEVKNVINTFTQTANHERCSYFGNITIGQDISFHELRTAYTAVVLAYGADDDKKFGIPGEDLSGVLSARSFVGWYNGLPANRELCPNLDTDVAVVLGQGNVAIDVARMLLTPIDILRKTDITEYALEALSRSRVQRVYLVGRRGPLQVAFTTAELRELVRLEGSRPRFNRADFEGLSDQMANIPRPRKRLTELLIKTATETPSESDKTRWAAAQKEWCLKFFRSPKEFLPFADGHSLAALRLTVNRLEGPVDKPKAVATDETEDIECGLAFRSIGYKSVPLEEGVPFDPAAAAIPNSKGRVPDEPGLYCSGWVKRGPIGVIVSTMNDAFETGRAVVEDLNSGHLVCTDNHRGSDYVRPLLESQGVQPVSFEDWTKLDTVETEWGQAKGKPREKAVDIKEMIKITKG